MYSFNLKITQDHIEKGHIRECESCPVALALLEQFPNAVNAYVDSAGGTVLCVGIPKQSIVFDEWPDVLSKWICAFDNHNLVEPIEVVVEYRVA